MAMETITKKDLKSENDILTRLFITKHYDDYRFRNYNSNTVIIKSDNDIKFWEKLFKLFLPYIQLRKIGDNFPMQFLITVYPVEKDRYYANQYETDRFFIYKQVKASYVKADEQTANKQGTLKVQTIDITEYYRIRTGVVDITECDGITVDDNAEELIAETEIETYKRKLWDG